MNKKQLVLIFAIFLLVFTFAIVSSEEGCCQNLKNGASCQRTTQDQCASTIVPTSCDSFTSCALGTCIDEDKGECMPNTPRSVCETEGGFWDPASKSDIPMCQNGCCLFGEYASFSTQTECKQLASVYGVDVNFRSDITNEFSCYNMAHPDVEGACIISGNETASDCKRTTRESCISSGGTFREGFLCTAPELATDCAKSDKTECKNDRVYFTDSCGNLANVYDESMFSKVPEKWTEKMEDYWTKIQSPSCSLSPGSSSCGDCSYIAGSVCKDYKSGNKNMPPKPVYGDKVCASLSCYYDSDGDKKDEIYKHGESWCAVSEGVYSDLNVSNQSLSYTNPKIEVENSKYSLYNLPGSRYYKLMCMDGEVIVEPCRDFRNEVCLQSDMGVGTENFKVAQCQVNTWRDCLAYIDQEICENSFFCKWVPGYRFDGQVVTSESERRNSKYQGSCVPSFSPGFDFWEPGNDGEAICSMGSVQENVVYETNLFTKRATFEDNPLCDLSINDDAVERCFESCYAIPGYGLEAPNSGGYAGVNDGTYLDVEDLLNAHLGLNNALPSKFESFCISDRRGYYCEGKTGEVGGNDAKCADTNTRIPIFLTHQEWVNSIKDRARALGDCGYKPGAYVDISDVDKELETVTALFQILKQDQSLKKNTSIEKIYWGDFEYIPGGELGGFRQ